MATYECSDGSRVTQDFIKRKMREAKAMKLQEQVDEFGYNFCEECERNDCKPIDCSHDISVQRAKDTNQTELCWDVSNITLRGRRCHQKHDGLDLKWNSSKK